MTKNVSAADAAVLIEQLISYSSDNLSLNYDDINYVRNQLLSQLKLYEPAPTSMKFSGELQKDILDPLISYAVSSGIIQDIEALLFETKLMGLVTPMPSRVIEDFDMIASSEGIDKASEYLYNLSINSNYIRMADVNKNVAWQFTGTQGDIKITINLSKPEKDPKEVLAAAKAPQSNYPKCRLCVTNVGFNGNFNYPARQTLRTIPIYLAEENWQLQYSPYAYFQEHLIALSDEHRPMVINEKTIRRMLDFVEIFPHYFIGSNAALPIVGGSILAHDHYQGGAKVMPMMGAESVADYINPMFQSVKLSVLDWYNSVIRLKGSDRKELERAANYVMDYWNSYSDESIGIFAKTTAQHNAITPIARLEGKSYVLDFILRNNRTDDKHPYGIYHPTEDLHNIKKESIGLIEAMGLFILPGRLYPESQEIKDYLTGVKKLNFKDLSDEKHPLNKHLGMIAQLTNDHGTAMEDADANEVIMQYINKACERILGCTAVFPAGEAGEKAFRDLVVSMGFDER